MKININSKLLIILIFAFLLRLISLNQSLWLDEAINTLAVKNNSLLDLITKYSLYDFHPPLYHVILYFWTKIFGYSEISVRFPSLLATMICIIVVYKIGSEFFSKKTGLVASLLLALSPLSLYYSQETRMYAFTMFLAASSFYFFLCLLQKSTSYKYLLGFIIFTALGMYSDYIYWFFALSLVLFLAIKSKLDKKKLLIIIVSLSLLLSPWLNFFLRQLSVGINQAKASPLWGDVVGGSSIKSFLLVPIKFSIGRISFFNKNFYTLFTVIVMSFNFLAIFFGYKKLKSKASPFLFIFFVPLILSFIISYFIPIFSYFRLLFLIPIFYLLISFSIYNLNNGKIILSSVIFFELICSSIYLFNPSFHRENWKDAVKYIEDNSTITSASLIVSLAQDAPYKYYSSGLVPIIDSQKISSRYDKIWFIRYAQPIFDPEEKVLKKVESMGFSKIQEKDFNGVTIWEYIK